jgi:GGDEF domain-containing protein
MSLQGPIIVVAEQPATELVAALGAAGAFPIIEANWNDAPTAFVSVKPAAVVIAEPGAPPSESSARMLCLQIATVKDAIVPTLAFAHHSDDVALPVALPADPNLPLSHAMTRLQAAMRVRGLHATVLRRIELVAEQGGVAAALPLTDPLDDATVLIAGRGPLYPALSVAMGERVKMVGALSVEAAAKHLNARDIDGIVMGDGLPPRMVETFLTMLVQEPRFRDIPVAVIGGAAPDFRDSLINIEFVDGDVSRIVGRMVPMVRLRAFETRLLRMLKSLDADGTFDTETGLLTRDSFLHQLTKAVAEAADRSQSLSMARYSFEGTHDRATLDGARLLTRLTRPVDFACRDDDGAILVAFTQTDLREAHMVARRIAAELKAIMKAGAAITANVTLATLKAGDTLDSLMQRVLGSRMVAAE